MKKILALLMGTMLVLGISGCSGNSQSSQNSSSEQSNKAETSELSGPHIEGKFVVGLDDEFPPMGFRDDNNEITGFDIDLAKAVGEKLGCEVEFQPIDWDTKELELESGNIDFIWNGLSITEERREKMEFTKPYLKNKQVIIVPNSSDITSKDALSGKNVGVQSGSSALEAVNNDPLSKDFASLNEYDTNILAFADLDIGRIDAVVADEVVARYYLETSGANLKVLENGDFGDELYGVAAKKGNTQLISDLQGALDEISQNGTAAEISNKWFGEDLYQH